MKPKRSAIGDEDGRAHRPAHRVMPAQQRLDAADHVPTAVDLRLVVQLELRQFDGLAEVVDQVELVRDVLMHVRLEQRVGAPTGALRGLHRGIGLGQQLVAFAVVREDHDADRDADLDASLGQVERRLHRLDDAVRQRDAVVGRVGAFHQHEELVAADPRHGVLVARLDAQSLRDLADHFVADRVAERIVDRLEAVDVDEQHGELLAQAADRLPRTIGPEQGLRQSILEEHAVGQAGQRVEHGALAQFVVGRDETRGDVLERAGQQRAALVDPAVDQRADQRADHQDRHGHRREAAQSRAVEGQRTEADRADRDTRRREERHVDGGEAEAEHERGDGTAHRHPSSLRAGAVVRRRTAARPRPRRRRCRRGRPGSGVPRHARREFDGREPRQLREAEHRGDHRGAAEQPEARLRRCGA